MHYNSLKFLKKMKLPWIFGVLKKIYPAEYNIFIICLQGHTKEFGYNRGSLNILNQLL